MKLRANWATGIVTTYVIFAAGTTAFAVYAMRRPVDLVAADYYERSLAEDRQMAAIRNTAALDGGASIAFDGNRAVIVTLPPAQAAAARGTVTLYRPSDASADREFALATDPSGRQRIRLDGLRAGLWSVRVRWTALGREFYLEQRIDLR
jgi:nitrogen fixation protein FixH